MRGSPRKGFLSGLATEGGLISREAGALSWLMPPSQRDDARTIFDEQWLTYRKVIDCDYMGHATIRGALLSYLAEHPEFSGSLGRVLDLGCGDAEISSALVGRFGCRSYLGVDASGMALQQAAARTDWGEVEPRFRESDLLSFLQEEGESFDVILVGFVLHHLDAEGKREFFRAVATRLRSGGVVLFYDVFLRPGLDRDTSVAAYLQWIREDWTEITSAEYDAIEAHIASSDFPESLSWILEAASEGGLKQASTQATCAEDFHHAIAFAR